MAKQLPPIEDRYGRQIAVDAALKSMGPAVYVTGSDDLFLRFTSDQARALATRLNQAADEIEGASS
jgi:hypothetical protein